MIYYLVIAPHAYTMRAYQQHWAGRFAAKIQVVPYFALHNRSSLPIGTYIFSDLERTTVQQRSFLSAIYSELQVGLDPAKLINHPADSARRYGLLHDLHERGLNSFKAYCAKDFSEEWNYPVFLRTENRHEGNLSPLINEPKILRQSVESLVKQGLDRENLLIVEFCDTQDADGLYRKYSSFRVGDVILPRHVFFSRRWMLKDMDILEPEHRIEIRTYCDTNPHERQLMEIFELANIQYGRIDYALLDGKIQVWEINTNPIIVKPPAQYPGFSIPFHTRFAFRFGAALANLDRAGLIKENPQ